MNDCSVEECPVCWRSYSSAVVPVTVSCGHSFCQECCENLKRCALCRRSVKASSRATNYSLLSLVSRLEQDKKEMVDKQVETEGAVLSRPKQMVSKSTEKNHDSLMAMKILLKLVNVQSQLSRLIISNSKASSN